MASKGKASTSNLSKEPNAEKKPREMKDLDDDLLIQIFKNLHINDLVNIVEYNDDFKTIALTVFKDKFGKDAINVTNKFYPHKETSSPSVKLLNRFGNEITKLVVKYHEDYREISKVVNDAIILQCSKTLEEIKFQNASRFTMFQICKQFENVHTVSFQHGQLCEIISQFSKWFPKAHTLKLNWQTFGKYCDYLNVENNPSLKHLEIGYLNKCNSSKMLLKKFIQLSPELKTLRIEIGSKGEIDLDDTLINTNLPNLETLHLNLRKVTSIFNFRKETLHFEMLKNLTIELQYSGLKDMQIMTDNLQTLKLCASDGFGKDCVKFFNYNRNVEVVELFGPYILDANAVISSFSKLPNLKEIEFPFPYVCKKDSQLDQIHAMLKDCKRLCKLTVTAQNIDRENIPQVESSMKAFADTVDVQWKSAVSKEVLPILFDSFRINYRLSVEKKQADRTCRMERRLKRKCTTSIESRNTRKKLKSTSKRLEFQNLTDYCLIEIFKHLSIDDLVNIVEYNNHFNTAALIAFKKRYGNDEIKISVEYNSMTKAPLWCIALLKYFGSEITKVRILYYKEDSRQIDDAIDNAVITYCHKSLVEILFMNSKSSTMNGIDRPFENVRTVSFVGGSVNKTIYDLGKWFPKAKTLKFENMDEPKESNKIHIKNAPGLEHFEIRLHTNYDYVYDTISEEIIVQNPQLKSLYNKYVLGGTRYYDYGNVGMDVNQTFVNLPMPNLESLHLILPNEKEIHETDTGYNENGKFHFKTLKHLHIEFEQSGVLKNLPISTDNLETLNLIGLERVKGSDCVSFIRDNQNVKFIKIVGCVINGIDSDIHTLCELFPTLPNLNELEFSYDHVFRFFPVSSYIDDLLERCKLLRKLVYNCVTVDDRQEIENQFNNADGAIKAQWKFSKDLNNTDYHQRNRYKLTFERIAL